MRLVTGRIYGVTVRGRLPKSFRPYLRPAPSGGARAAETLEVRYRPGHELPEIDEIWASDDQHRADGLTNDVRFALAGNAARFQLALRGTAGGLFRGSPDRIEVEWAGEETAAAHHFVSYALPLWLEARGTPVLHASVVAIGRRAVGLLGPSGVGKSTLAAGLSQLGCEFLADDGLALRRSGTGRWHAWHGPPLVRLWPSSLDRLGIDAEGLPRVSGALEKRRVNLQENLRPASGEAPSGGPGSRPVAALYLLERRPETAWRSESTAKVTDFPPRVAVARLIEHGVAAAPARALGLSARRLDRLADLVESVPVRRLRFSGGTDSAARVLDGIVGDLGTAPARSPFLPSP